MLFGSTVLPSPTSRQLNDLYRTYGPSKQMGEAAPALDRPHFFLHRSFLGEQDLAILFNTKRCRFQCKFCALPSKSSRDWIPAESILSQFSYVMDEVRHSLGVLDRLTIANEGSVLDETTFPATALDEIVEATKVLPRVRKVVLETRMQFVSEERLRQLQSVGKRLDLLTGFESRDERIREDTLGKTEPLELFQSGLDALAAVGGDLTTYVLFKPDPEMTDDEAVAEAEASIEYVRESCRRRDIPLTIRLNPMYVARGTAWARRASQVPDYRPPRLSDVIALANKKRAEGIAVYVGLTSEGLSDEDKTYRGREDFTRALLKEGILINGSGSVTPAQHLKAEHAREHP